MSKLNSGGNPLLDRKPAVERFNTDVEPVFLNNGFRRLNKKSHVFINDDFKSIVHVTSSPSQLMLPNHIKQKIKKFSKEFKGYSHNLFFTRDYSEWAEKQWYQNTLRQVIRISKLNGVAVGLDMLDRMINRIESNESFTLIG